MEGILLKDIKWIFVFYSLAAVASMCAIGISVAIASIPFGPSRYRRAHSYYGQRLQNEKTNARTRFI